jgi:hypothetical protein
MGGTGKTQHQISIDTELMLSSMFPFLVLLDPLFLPLPCSPSYESSRKIQKLVRSLNSCATLWRISYV